MTKYEELKKSLTVTMDRPPLVPTPQADATTSEAANESNGADYTKLQKEFERRATEGRFAVSDLAVKR